MVSVRIPGLSISRTARPLVADALDTAGAAGRSEVVDLLKKAAGTDGNRYLSQAEAALVKDAIEATVGPAGPDLAVARASVADQIAERLKARDPDGIKTYFTSTTPDMSQLVIDQMKDIVAKANGKQVDFNIMIFAFVEKKIGDAMLQIAQEHPNVTFRLIADFGQLSDVGDRQPPRLAKDAAALGLTNVHVRFKKDSPFVWDATRKRVTYAHPASKGLNHHKGFVALIDGKPAKMATGSFNWSPTAAKKNYENLFVLDSNNPANRQILADYQAEFTAFFNHPDALTMEQARYHRAQVTNALRIAAGEDPFALPETPAPGTAYIPKKAADSFDLNHLSDENYEKLKKLVDDPALVGTIVRQYASYGPFASFAELVERVPRIARLPEARRAELESAFELGEGRVPLNTATADELTRCLGISKTAALAIIAKRASVGDFESVEQIRGLPGLSDSVFQRIAPRLNDDIGRAYFSARGFDSSEPGRGWHPSNASKTFPVMGTDGVVAEQPASLASGVIDLLNRAKSGDVAKIAMYGMSVSTPEYVATVDAAARGVHVKVVLNDDYNGGVASALHALSLQGHPIEVRIQKAKTMHEKFGVVNDDVFDGSANFSGSSSTKHSEDRFVVKNNADLAADFHAEFDLLFGKSKPVVA